MPSRLVQSVSLLENLVWLLDPGDCGPFCLYLYASKVRSQPMGLIAAPARPQERALDASIVALRPS